MCKTTPTLSFSIRHVIYLLLHIGGGLLTKGKSTIGKICLQQALQPAENGDPCINA
jgi:hypothetical protein